MNKSIEYRKDNRTFSQFEEDIKRDTYRENIAMSILVAHLKEKNPNTEINFLDFGMDNSGKVVSDKNKVNAKPDFKLFVDGKKNNIEVKVHSDRYKCMTFKKSNINTYIKYKASIAVFTESRCYIFSQKSLHFIQKNFPAKSYKGFAAGKPAHRLHFCDISVLHIAGLVTIIEWGEKAQQLVKFYKNIFKARNN